MKCVNNYRIGIADHRCILNYESRYISNKYPALKARKRDVAKTQKKNRHEFTYNSRGRNRDRDMGHHEVNGGDDDGNPAHVHAS